MPQFQRTVHRQYMSLRLDQLYLQFGMGDVVFLVHPTFLFRNVLSVMQRQEPHHEVIAAMSNDKETATDSTFHAF